MFNRIGLVIVVCVAAVLVTLALTGGVTQAEPNAVPSKSSSSRWQIHRSEYSYEEDSKAKTSINTILLDSETGETWMLMASEKENEQYYWLKMPKR